MAKKNDCWGIEVGANAIKAMRLVNEGGKAAIVDYDVVPFKKVLTTPDLDVDEAIQVNLDQFMGRRDVSRSSIAVSVPGHSAFARFAKLPPVEPKKIPDIVRFEAVQQIPFPIDQVEWDYQIFQQEDSPDVEVGIFAITKDKVAQYLANYRQVGLEIDYLTLSPLAVYNALAYDRNIDESSDGIVLMDVGTSSTDLIIVENGQIWLRTMPIGGNNFTEALVKAFKLSFPKAEKLKREAATSKYAKQIFQAMRPVFAELVQEMQRSLGHYQTVNRDAELKKVIGMGSTFRLPGLQKFLKQQLQLDVERLDSFERIAVEGKDASDFAEHTMNMATAYGLALQGLGLEQVGASVLPQHIIKQRIWRAKQPWMATAAAIFIAATGLAGAKLYMDSAAYHSEMADSKNEYNTVVQRAQDYVNSYNNIKKDDKRPLIENFRRGLDYRHVWPLIMYDLSQAAQSVDPQPAFQTPDYEQISQVGGAQGRSAWKFVRIERIEFSYVVSGPAGTSEPVGVANVYESVGEDGAVVPAPEGTIPPRFMVRITGSTPNSGKAAFVGKFVSWFRDNAERADRPYTFDTIEMKSISTLKGGPRPDAGSPDGGRGLGDIEGSPGRGRGRGTSGGLGSPGGLGGGLGSPGGGLGSPSPDPVAPKAIDTTAAFPERAIEPLAEGDSTFVVELVIDIKKPGEARDSERVFLTTTEPTTPNGDATGDSGDKTDEDEATESVAAAEVNR